LLDLIEQVEARGIPSITSTPAAVWHHLHHRGAVRSVLSLSVRSLLERIDDAATPHHSPNPAARWSAMQVCWRARCSIRRSPAGSRMAISLAPGRTSAVDAAMNDWMRPAMSPQAWMNIVACELRDEPATLCDVVGPVLSRATGFGRASETAVHAGDFVVVLSAGGIRHDDGQQLYHARPCCRGVMVCNDRAF
jgi:hypothetical protein